MLSPGSWDLSISASGYSDTLIKNVVVQDLRGTTLKIELSIRNSLLIYPNPASTNMSMLMPANMSGKIRITVFSTSGVKISDYDAVAITGFPLEYNVSRLAAGVYNVHVFNFLTGASVTGRFVVLHK
jgi:hypothetical protein